MIVSRFETVLADTATARDIHHHVRFRVFCEETGFEDRSRFPDGLERDDFDDQAAHFIIWDRQERDWVAAVRLVPAAERSLPCETICKQELFGLNARRRRAVEFSRLCILARHRQVKAGLLLGVTTINRERGGAERPVFFRQEDHEIFLRLLRASIAWGYQAGIHFYYFIATKPLSRMLKNFGIPLEVVGEAVEHRGARAPFACHIDEAHTGMLETLPGYARMVRNTPAFVAYSAFIQQPTEPAGSSGAVFDFPTEVAAETHRGFKPQRWPLAFSNSNAA